MKRHLVGALLAVVVVAGTARAGLFGKKQAKPNPADRVPELLKILKTDGDEKKRADAAGELRQYDPAAFPHIYPGLIDALLNDAKPSVRAEAAQSLGKMRPVSPVVGQALEQAREKDSAMRVRLQARSALLSYGWAGYKGGKSGETPTQSNEPPLADPKHSPPARRQQPSATGPVLDKTTTQEPPLATMPNSRSGEVSRSPNPTTPGVIPGYRSIPQGQNRKGSESQEPPLASPVPPTTPAPTHPIPLPLPEAPGPQPGPGSGDKSGPDLGPPDAGIK